MSDGRLRELERRWKASGLIGDRDIFLVVLRRAGRDAEARCIAFLTANRPEHYVLVINDNPEWDLDQWADAFGYSVDLKTDEGDVVAIFTRHGVDKNETSWGGR